MTEKNDKLVDFPLAGLDLSEFYRGTGDEAAIYDCYAVSNHYGSLSFGHYTAYGKNRRTGQWYHFDDSRVEPLRNVDEVVSKASYVIFYEKRGSCHAQSESDEDS
jgi:ubiquitin carboxyl-terminal hydrolase 4/11/15